MKNLLRLLRYGLPYGLQLLPGVLLLAMVGVLDTFRTLLFQPIFDRVLRPDTPPGPIVLGLPNSQWQFDLRALIPPFMHQHNAWNVVAIALVVSTVAKGFCDYLGTYLVNYAGFGMITDLRNHLYEATMRRSASFFHKHATGTILSTLINDVDKVQTAVSSVIGEFLQQFFTFLVGIIFVIRMGGYLSWALLLFVPVVISSSRRIGREVRTRTRTGQDKLAEIQNILHETVTGNRIVKAFNTELWEILRFKKAASRLFRANLRSVRIQSISSPLMDTIGAIAIALLLLIGRNEILHGRMTMGLFGTFIILLFKLYDPVRKFAYFYNSFQQAMGASASIFGFFDTKDDVRERAHAMNMQPFHESIRFENVGFSYSTEEGELRTGHLVDAKAHVDHGLQALGHVDVHQAMRVRDQGIDHGILDRDRTGVEVLHRFKDGPSQGREVRLIQGHDLVAVVDGEFIVFHCRSSKMTKATRVNGWPSSGYSVLQMSGLARPAAITGPCCLRFSPPSCRWGYRGSGRRAWP